MVKSSDASARRQRRWEVENSVAPSVYFGLDRKLCGIYTLEFEGGQRYVGQTVDLASRLAAHRRRWDDIIAISFVECGLEELNTLERTMIADTEKSFAVRNRAFTNMPGGDAALDLVVDVQEQAEWLSGVRPAYPLDERTLAAERRQRTRPKFEQLAALDHFPEVLADLSTYIHAVIPWPSTTGGLYWGVSAMPGTARTKERRRYFTVNAHNVELLFMHHFSDDGTTESVLNVDGTKLSRADRRELYITEGYYRSYPDAEALYVPLGAMAELYERPTVLAAARSMALGLMRRGPSNFAKFHSDDLLDAVLLQRNEPAVQ
ncbi:GIY-YIG nuclease family protein [Brachybacterium paraconglomeratum]|uniref:GIY-YIG nuclease family protein n=1 Tax=Brachybacterium paraconglomeratum TaxID=173362 RepID=UPI003FD68D52